MRVQRHPRVRPKKSEPIEVQIMGEGFLEVLHARDISCGGVGVLVSHGFEGYDLDQEVELILSLPGVRSFCIGGRIRHSSEYRGDTFFGVEFVDLPREDRRKIKRYVKERQRADS